MINYIIETIDSNLKTIYPSTTDRDFTQHQKYFMSDYDRKKAGRMMRVNHVGEVCAQALYIAQIYTAHTEKLSTTLEHAKHEEIDHLIWCKKAMDRLDTHPSHILEIWFLGALLLSYTISFLSDEQNAAFLDETEQQVGRHLEGHLAILPWIDTQSQFILDKMWGEELGHSETAQQFTNSKLHPLLIKVMKAQSKLMTTVALYV